MAVIVVEVKTAKIALYAKSPATTMNPKMTAAYVTLSLLVALEAFEKPMTALINRVI